MKSYKKEMHFNIPARRGLVNITRDVQEAINESGVQEGLCLINPMHITASVIINDDEAGLHRDYERLLERLVPEKPYEQYDHNGFEDNADALSQLILIFAVTGFCVIFTASFTIS